MATVDPRVMPPRTGERRRAPTFFFNDTAPTEIYTLSLHDALPISGTTLGAYTATGGYLSSSTYTGAHPNIRNDIFRSEEHTSELRHQIISYAVFCLKKKTICSPHPPSLHHDPAAPRARSEIPIIRR